MVALWWIQDAISVAESLKTDVLLCNILRRKQKLELGCVEAQSAAHV